jgi:hypothetical protein
VPELWLRRDPGLRLLSELLRASSTPTADRRCPDHRGRRAPRARGGRACRAAATRGCRSVRRADHHDADRNWADRIAERFADRVTLCHFTNASSANAFSGANGDAVSLGAVGQSGGFDLAILGLFALTVPARLITIAYGGSGEPGDPESIGRSSIDRDLAWSRDGRTAVLMPMPVVTKPA